MFHLINHSKIIFCLLALVLAMSLTTSRVISQVDAKPYPKGDNFRFRPFKALKEAAVGGVLGISNVAGKAVGAFNQGRSKK